MIVTRMKMYPLHRFCLSAETLGPYVPVENVLLGCRQHQLDASIWQEY